jgi:RNA polymerase sigma factor (sigma-70 family)
MKTLNELAIEYKQTKDSKICNQIFELLKDKIKEKVKYIFYQQSFFGEKNVILSKTKKVEIGDVAQELNLFVLELLEKYDITKPFENYLYHSLSLWKPNFININFLREITGTISETDMVDEEGNSTFENTAITNPSQMEGIINYETLFKKLTLEEKMIINILRKNPDLNQSEVARRVGLSRERISQIYESLRKKYKNRLTK